MEENVKKELDTLKEMLTNWIEDYKKYITAEGPNAYLLEDFEEEINKIMLPYVRRLIECGYCTIEETQPIANHANKCVKDFLAEEEKIVEEAKFAKEQKDDERKTIADFLKTKLDFDSFIIAGFREKDWNKFVLTGDSELGPFVYVTYGNNPECIVYLINHILEKEPLIKNEILEILDAGRASKNPH